MKRLVLVLVAVGSISGCCAFSSRSCYPACPPPTVIEVSKCKLPDPVLLPPYTKALGCPDGLYCFDGANMFNILRRDSLMQNWIKEAKLRCSPPTSAPAAQPSQ